MNSRERVIKAIEFRSPDRIPIYQQYLPRALLIYGRDLLDVLSKYPHDFGSRLDLVFSEDETDVDKLIKEKLGNRQELYTDDWGSIWRENVSALQGQVIEPVLSNWKELDVLHFPPIPFEDEEAFGNEGLRVSQKKERGYVIGAYDQRYSNFSGGFTLFQRLFWLRGMENLLIDIAKDRKELYILADRIVDYLSKAIKRVLQLRVDGIFFADDWGDQENLLINPDFWRKFFKPRYKKLFDIVHQHDAHVFFHSDGYIMQIIPDLIGLGVDVLNPQFSCMDLEELSSVTKEKICILTDVDRQQILPFSSPEEVKHYVKKVIELFGARKGGLIGRGEIGPDVPLANTKAMFNAFVEYGKLDR